MQRALRPLAPLALCLGLVAAACADSDSTTSSLTSTTASSATSTTTAASSTTSRAASPTTGGATTTAGDVASLQDALASGDLSTLARAVGVIGVDKLVDTDEFTFFAPNDDAFRALSATDLAKLLGNPTELDDVLRNHLVKQKLTVADLRALPSVETAAGTTLPVMVSGDAVTVGGAQIVEADRQAGSGGLIQVIDHVLVPQS